MASDETLIQTRTKWVSIYQQLGNITVAARRCGIARSTLQRWLKRQSVEGLADKSRRPHQLARKKFDDTVENLVLDIRDKFNFGKIRICSHLFQHYQIKTSPTTVARILKQNQCAPIKRYRKQQSFIRYSRPVPGDRVQIDVCKIKNGLYQYTAIDDCSRFRLLYTYKRKTATNTLDFLEWLLEQFPYPIQRIQTDRGREFLPIYFRRN